MTRAPHTPPNEESQSAPAPSTSGDPAPTHTTTRRSAAREKQEEPAPHTRGATEPTAPAPYLLGWLVLVALALHAWDKSRLGLLWEMLWSCHIASLVIALGILAHRPRWSGAGLLFHLSTGIPGYVLDALATQTTRPTSVLVHTLPAVAGWVMARRQGLPRDSWRWAWLGLLAVMGLSYAITPPDLNINLVFRPWDFSSGYFSSALVAHLPNVVYSATSLFVWDRLLRRVWKFRA